MARQPRLQYEGALYHVYPRGNRRQRIAHTVQDYRILERYFLEAACKTEVIPRAWQPMPNHFHAMLETPFGNLADFMQIWLSRYARYYNRTYQKIGHLFQGRYGSRLVQADGYQRELIRYIHLQKYRAKNPKNIDPACDYYSSYRFYMGECGLPQTRGWIEPMLNLFGDTPTRARENLARYLADGLKKGEWQDFYKSNSGVIGTVDFLNTIESHQQTRVIKTQSSKPRQSKLLDELLDSAAAAFNVKRDQLISHSQRRDLSRIRKAIAYMGRGMGLTATALAAALHRGRTAISPMSENAERQAADEVQKLREWLNG